MSTEPSAGDGGLHAYLMAVVDNELLGLPIARITEIFKANRLTRVPLAAPEIAGLLNLRGRVITAIDLRRHLGHSAHNGVQPVMAVGTEVGGEAYALLVDSVEAIMNLAKDDHEPIPLNLAPRLARIAAGIHEINGRRLILLDVDALVGGGSACGP
jgi:purine-binding chemotaxis protein CheW